MTDTNVPAEAAPVAAPESVSPPNEIKTDAFTAEKPEPQKPAKRSIDDAIASAEKKLNAEQKTVAAREAKASKDAENADIKSDAKTDTKDEKPTEKAKPAEKVDPGKKAKDVYAVPERFSSEAKAEWETLNNGHVKAEVNRALREAEAGVAKNKEAFEKYEPLRKFEEMASKSGTTIHEAFENYVSLDTALRDSDPQKRLAAIEQILDHAGITPQKYAEFITKGGYQPQQQQEAAGENETTRALRAQVQQLQQQMGQFTNSLQQQQQDQQRAYYNQWAADKPDIQDLAEDVARYHLEDNLSLDDAYAKAKIEAREKAIRLGFIQVGDNTAAQTRNLQAAQTRAKSITGAPVNGSDPSYRGGSKISINDAIDRAFAKAGY